MEPQDIDTCIRCGGYVETVNEQPGARCSHCGVRLDVTHSITFDEQEEARALGYSGGDEGQHPLWDGEVAEVIDGMWHITVDGEESRARDHVAEMLDRLLGFIYRTSAVASPEGRRF